MLPSLFAIWRCNFRPAAIVQGISAQDALALQRQWKSWQLEWTGLA
jgi:hypothetical protein